ncbi:MAG: lytic transglycosylase domain-containing protein, partial [Actinobacteria bacterium]|nr:lytic transglycosylase domain-containing protein [Actinomycetota bacterium]
MLPASWTSLAPLTLPHFDIEGFPIPPFLLPVYQAAAAQYGVPWEILASINEIESDFGRNATVSSAGAMGWMQFIRSSWERWGTDGDEDGRRDPRDPVDAIFAAARYLRDAGAATDLPKAIFAYNHAGWYVEKVVRRAREFAGLDATLVGVLSRRALREDTRLYRAAGNPFAGDGAVEPSAGQALLLTKRQLTRIVLHSDDIDVYPGGRQDIADGHIDRRVLATLVFLARSGLEPTVSSLTTGHSRLTTSGNVSAHSYGHAVDISAIKGVPIAGHQGAKSITATTLDKLVGLQGYLRPNQIISLMTVAGHANT